VIKPVLKAPDLQRLNLEYDEPLAKLAFNFHLRRYAKVAVLQMHGTGTGLGDPIEVAPARYYSRHVIQRALNPRVMS
jgi:hypothetical protein